MPNFLARVLLHGKEEADYKSLHKHMREKGFYPHFKEQVKRYHLPTGTYHCHADITLTEAETRIVVALTKAGFPVGKETDTPVDGTSAYVVAHSELAYKHGGLKREQLLPKVPIKPSAAKKRP